MARVRVRAKKTRLPMTDPRRLIRSTMSALIDGTYGCLDAAAEAINTRLHLSVSKGTLSKRMSGQHGWPVDEIIALEDAAGSYPVTRLMVRRLQGRKDASEGCLYRQSGLASREAGEAIAAALNAARVAGGPAVDPDDRAEAIREVTEAERAFAALRAQLEGGS